MSQPPNPNQQNMIQMMQPAQVSQLVEALKEELAQGKAAGADSAKARQHFAKANQIKQVLLKYQQQHKAQQARANGQIPPTTGGQPSPGQPMTNMASGSQLPAGNSPATGAQAPPMAQQQYTNTLPPGAGRQTTPSNVPNPAMAAQTRPNTGPTTMGAAPGASGVTAEKYNQVRARIQDVDRKIRSLEASKRPDMDEEEAKQINDQLNELREKYGKYSKFAVYMRNQLMEQSRGTLSAGSPAPRAGSPPVPLSSGAIPSTGASMTNMNVQAARPQPASAGSVVAPATTNPAMVVANANANAGAPQDSSRPPSAPASAPQTGAGTPSKGQSVSPQPKDGAGVPGMNLLGITKPSVPSLPILSTINVNPPAPITLKPGANNMRPTLAGGSASGLGPMMGTPAIVRMPTFDMASTGPIPDNSGRVLTKRKLTELVNTIGADEGDGKTTIDGDVEELLLDLADEFVLSVTSFACRLAKHRKTESVDVRDVQLHLERNWNIRIPGHAMDEIRGMRKWQPSSSYNQKVSGVEIAKAVNGNIN